MKIYMLHFDCQPDGKNTHSSHWNADLCSISNSFEEAEAQARDIIASHAYTAGELISFLEVTPSQISHLSQDETLLYLKAQQHTPLCAVFFSTENI
jgi:hypothetical protein